MPTPFYHLRVAEDILSHPGLPSQSRLFLQENRPAFLLGNTAPDVQTISGQGREVTHFFDVPIIPGSKPAWERLVSEHPSLGRTESLPPEKAAFLAGYLCHLQADWQWILTIYSPVFGPGRPWKTFKQRLYLHNVLRAYLDRSILAEFPQATVNNLEAARPDCWLPFVQDVHLYRWRDFLVSQFMPGASVQTVEVFAARQGISPEEYYQMLESEERLETEIFARLPRTTLAEYRRRLVESNIRLLQHYFSPIEIH